VSARVLGGNNHEAYITFLLSCRRPSAAEEACGWLQKLIKQTPIVRSSLQALLWQAVLDETVASLPVCKESLSSLVTYRLSARVPLPSNEDHDQLPQHPPPSNAADLLLRTSEHIFPRGIYVHGRSPSQIINQDWSTYHAQALFNADLPRETRWKHLTCLALANSSNVHFPSVLRLLQGQDQNRLHPLDIRVTILLTLLERHGEQGKLDTELLPFVHQLWDSWYQAARKADDLHPTLLRPIVASFFSLAGRLCDDTLRKRTFSVATPQSWAYAFGDDHAREQVQSLVSDYIAASALCGRTVWEEILHDVPYTAAFPQWRAKLVGQALVRIAHMDPEVAFQRYNVWAGSLSIPDNCFAPMCRAAADANMVDHALSLLGNCVWTGPEAQETLMAVISALRRTRLPTNNTGLFWTLGGHLLTVAKISHPFPRHQHGHIFWLLSALIRKSQSPLAMDVMRAIYADNPLYFRRKDVNVFVHLLLHYQQYELALELVERVRDLFTRRTISIWARMTIVALARQPQNPRVTPRALSRRARDLVTEPAIVADPYLRVLSSFLTRSGYRTERMRLLRLHTTRVAAARTPAFLHAMLRLFRMRSWRIMERTVRRVAPTLRERERTVLGNALLELWVRGRHAHVDSADALARTLDELGARIGFAPDRVTLNIIAKRLLRERKLGVRATKALFNALIADGYPITGGFSAERLPFEGVGTSGELVGLREAVRGQRMSFARVVRPFYRLFAWALLARGDKGSARFLVRMLGEVATEHAHKMETERRRRREQRRGAEIL
jgi:hypothetical protein